jgi:predicted TIM-barrel fold metal-dependent hydrolase
MTTNRIFDSHIHLNPQLTLHDSLSILRQRMFDAQVDGGLLIHLDTDPWNFSDLCDEVREIPNLKVFVNLNLKQSAQGIERDLRKIKDAGAIGIKLHPRRQCLSLTEAEVYLALDTIQELQLKVNICSFDDGSWSRIGLEASSFLALADKYKETFFLWSHAGGYRVLEFMMMARRTSNVYLDSSFTQGYFFKGSVREDLNYATESLPERFMFGTDTEMDNYVEVVASNKEFFLTHNPDRSDFFSGNLIRYLEM